MSTPNQTEDRLEHLPEVLTVEEARGVLRLGRSSMYDALRRGQIPAIKIGRRLLIPKARLVRLLHSDHSP